MLREKVFEWNNTKSVSLAHDICEELVHNLSTDSAGELVEKVALWGRDKNLDDPKAQLNKVIEEVGEMAHEICRNNYDSYLLSDAIGDTLVTVIILADILGMDPIMCLSAAYNEIKARSGETKNGTFVKD